MDKECKSSMKVCYKKSEQIYKSFYHAVFLEICKSFQLMPKGGSEEKALHGRDIKRLLKEMGWEFAVYGIEMSGFVIRRTL